MKKSIIFSFIILSFTSCTYKTFTDTIEEVYTDEIVVKPTKNNYKTVPTVSTKPIIEEPNEKRSPQELEKEKTTRFKKIGHIISSSYDPDIHLYIYNFLSDGDNEASIFFYDKKLPYNSNELVIIDVKDNFLMTINKKNNNETTSTLTLSQKKSKFKKKRLNYNIQTPIEEKINTF